MTPKQPPTLVVRCSPALAAELRATDEANARRADELETDARRAGLLMLRWTVGTVAALAVLAALPSWVPGRGLLGIAGVMASVALLIGLQVLFLDRWSSSAKAKSIRASFDARIRLIGDALQGEPFGLYLRDYGSERRKGVHIGPAGTMPVDEVDPIEESLDGTIGRRIPLYGLSNADEEFGPGGITRVASICDWLRAVEACAVRAELVVLSIDELTPALLQEIDVLERRGLGSKVFITANRHGWARIERARPAFLETARWKSVRGSRSGPLVASDRGADARVPRALVDSLPTTATLRRRLRISGRAPLDQRTALAVLLHELEHLQAPAEGDLEVLVDILAPEASPTDA